MEIESTIFYVYVVKRPGIEDLLRAVSKFYEIVIYTASLSRYADPLVNLIDPEHFTDHKLFREHCTNYENAYVKDLSLLGRDLKNVVIIDNSPVSYIFQPENAIPILTWTNDMNDQQLYQLIPVLEKLAKFEDVRKGISKIVNNGQIDYLEADRILASTHKNKKKIHLNCWVERCDTMPSNVEEQERKMKNSESTKRISNDSKCSNKSPLQPKNRYGTPGKIISFIK